MAKYLVAFFLFSSTCLGQFIKNMGQWDSSILFKTDIPGGYLLIKDSGLEYHLADYPAHGVPGEFSFKRDRLQITFMNAKVIEIEQKNLLHAVSNFIKGNDPSKWKMNVPTFAKVELHGLYPNIDLRLERKGDAVKYEFVVKPGGKVSDIALEYDALHQPKILDDALQIETKVGVLKEFPPFSYQTFSQARKVIPSTYELKGNTLKFRVEDYDASKELIIDPEIVFSTFTGSRSDNWAQTATYDAEGNLYAGGTVFGEIFPITSGAFQTTPGGASQNASGLNLTDVVIQKYSADGQKLLYSTFLGGEESEVAHSLIVNSKGQLVVFGTTSSETFPVTDRGYSKEFKGGPSLLGSATITSRIGYRKGADLFLSILNSEGNALVGSTYLGGTENDGIHNNASLLIKNYGDEFRGEVYTDKQDKIYIATTTRSNDFPVVNGSAYDRSNDGIICRFNQDLTRLEWSTHVGGRFYDAAYGVRVNEKNEVYVVGASLSDGLATSSAFQRNRAGEADGFIAKFVNDRLNAFTYFGTRSEDLGMFLDLDPEGNIVVFGLTKGEYPISSGKYNSRISGQFIHSFTQDLSGSNYSTTFGSARGQGFVDITPTAFMLNRCGNIYIAGWGGQTNTSNNLNPESSTSALPITDDAIQSQTNGSNFYFAILEAEAKSLLFGTHFGSPSPPDINNLRGDHVDGGTCRFDKNGVIYHVACACRAFDINGTMNFPLKNPLQPNHNSSNCNMAAFKLDIGGLRSEFDILDGDRLNPLVVCNTNKLNLKNKSTNTRASEWFINGVLASRTTDVSNFAFPDTGTYVIKLKGLNVLNCFQEDSVERVIQVKRFEVETSADTAICAGASLKLKALGGESYFWTGNGILSNPNLNEIEVSIQENSVFKVQVESDICKVEKEIKVEIDTSPLDFRVSPGNKEICKGDEISLRASGSTLFLKWVGDGKVDSTAENVLEIKVKPTKTTQYTASALFENGCAPEVKVQLTIDTTFLPKWEYNVEYFCDSPSSVFFAYSPDEKVESYEWNFGNGMSVINASPDNYQYKSSGAYLVSLAATNAIGCTLVSSQVLDIPESDGFIPNAISPNGDGKNDTFALKMGEVQLKIFNRFGKLVFESERYENNWGTDVSSGTYFYEIKLENGQLCKGWLEVFN